jgi:hypothetical protein
MVMIWTTVHIVVVAFNNGLTYVIELTEMDANVKLYEVEMVQQVTVKGYEASESFLLPTSSLLIVDPLRIVLCAV